MSFLTEWSSLLSKKEFDTLLERVCISTHCHYQLLKDQSPIQLTIFKCICAFLNLDPSFPHNKNACCTERYTHVSGQKRAAIANFFPAYLSYVSDLNEVDSYGNSYMHYIADLAINPNLKSTIMQRAIERGAHQFPNSENITPLQVAALKGDGACVRTVISNYGNISSAEIIQACGIVLYSTPFHGFHASCRKYFQQEIQNHLPAFRANPTFYLGATMSKETVEMFETIFASIDEDTYTQVQVDYKQSFTQQSQVIHQTITPPSGEIVSQMLQKHEFFSFATIYDILMQYYSTNSTSVRGACLVSARPYIKLYQNKLISLLFKRPLHMQNIDLNRLKRQFLGSFRYWLDSALRVMETHIPLLSPNAALFMLLESQAAVEEYLHIACLYLDCIRQIPGKQNVNIFEKESKEVAIAFLSFCDSVTALTTLVSADVSNESVHSFLRLGFYPIHCLSRIKTDTSTNPSSFVVISLLDHLMPTQKHLLNEYDDQGRTPLHWAVLKKSEIIVYLIEVGAYPHAIDKKRKLSALKLLRAEKRIPKGAKKCYKQLHDMVQPLKALSAIKIASLPDELSAFLPKDLAYFVYLHQISYGEIYPDISKLNDEYNPEIMPMKMLKENLVAKNQIIYHF